MDWISAINDFEKRQKEVLQHSIKTVEAYHKNLMLFADAMQSKNINDPSNVTVKDIEEFMVQRSAVYANTSQNQMVTTLRQFYKDYQNFHHGTTNPTLFLKSNKTVKQLPIFLTELEIQKFLGQEDRCRIHQPAAGQDRQCDHQRGAGIHRLAVQSPAEQ